MAKSSAKISKETADFLLEKAQLMLDMRNWHTARSSKDNASSPAILYAYYL